MFRTINGARLFFDVDGAEYVADGPTLRRRPTVILLHGGPGADHAIHKPEWDWLTDHAQVIYLDHRGNGRSDQSAPEHWNLAQWGDDVRGLCDDLGVERPIVIGTSFGGFVAQAYATRHPGHAGGLILISTAAKFDFEAVYAAFGQIGGAEAGAAARAYWSQPTVPTRRRYHEVCFPLYTRRPMDPNLMGRIILKDDVALWFNGPDNERGAMDFRADLARIECPVMVMCGRDDPITPHAFSDAIVEALPGAPRYRLYDDCGHGVVTDQPEAAFAEIRAFIEENA
ncbi:MAG: alpha/beta hydrolase [Pseudomonadota bacterium]